MPPVSPEQPDPAGDLAHIRQVLDRHTRFLSLSGLSGVASGLVALVGAALAYAYLHRHGLIHGGVFGRVRLSLAAQPEHVLALGLLAAATLALALGLVAFFTRRLARRRGLQQVWTPTSRRLAQQLFVAVGVGAVCCAALVWHDLGYLVAPTSLVFYGLGLYAASSYTLGEIRALGLSVIVLGLIGLFYPGAGLALWATGFGLLSILYGLHMYRRYESSDAVPDLSE